MDIDDHKQMEESLKDADRRKDEFLAMLAHELRNPLMPIRSGLDVLSLELGKDHKVVKLMQEQVEHVVRLVEDLLDVSRITQGKIDLRKEPVQLADLIKRSVETIASVFDRRQQDLVLRVPDQTIWLNADVVRIVQVIENLLNNASKYTDAGGRIELSAERQDGQAVISVRDTGIGIDPELLPRVFDLFTQSSRSLDRAQGGMGIGLTLVKRLVEMHAGSISVESDGVGCGSTFTVRFPVIECVVPAEKPVERPTVAQNRRVLVVDDNVGAAWMLSRLLTTLGDHQVETVHDGSSALAKIKETHPEIVLLDIGLPGMNGFEVARTLRKDPAFNDVLLVALTGYGQEEDRQQSKAAGFDVHLVKPPSVEQLKEILGYPKLRTINQNQRDAI